MTEPKESASQELRGVVDSGAESFAVDGISETAEVETKEGEASAEKEKSEEKAGEEKPAEEKEITTPALEEDDEKKIEEKKGEEKEVKEKPGEEPSAELPEEELPKGIKKRLATITRKRHEAERETATIRAENEALLARVEALEHPEGTEEEPQIDDFETETEYQEAVVDWKANQIVAEREAAKIVEEEEEAKKIQEAEAGEREGNFKAELQKGVEKYEDFEDVIEDLNITGDMIHVLESLPNIPEVVYELGNNPETVADLVEIPFLQAAYRMKEISDGLMKKKTTKAPAPVKPVSTSGGAIKLPEQMSQKEYNAYRDKQDKERRGTY